jgi:phosphate transport system substrate-binding protein
MRNFLKVYSGILIASLMFFGSCKKNEVRDGETILTGSTTIYVDETLLPIIEDQKAVFENQYDAQLNLVAKSETAVINALLNDSVQIVVLSRNLSPDELRVIKSKKIKPKITPFALDGIAFIRNKKSNDTLIDFRDVIDFINGKEVNSIKGLVFDNPNSSTVSYLSAVAGKPVISQKNVFSFNTNEEVMKHISQNDGMIGVVGVNWLYQPSLELQKITNKFNVLSLKGLDSKEYVFPSQDLIASRKYPLARDLYIINCQGYSGLGMGFASFIGGERGQRIILKSGLVPVRFPGRMIITRNNIEKENPKKK